MTGFFWGFLLVFLDFSLNLNGHEIGLFPDFLGFLIIFRAARRMGTRSSFFPQLARIGRMMLVFSAGLYLLDALGITQNLGTLGHFLSLFCTAAGLWAALLLTRAVQELQVLHSCDLNADALRSAWNVMAVCQMVSYLFLMNVLLSTVFSLIAFGASIYYLTRFSCCSRLWSDRV